MVPADPFLGDPPAATAPGPVFASPHKRGRTRLVATIVGRALLLAGASGS